jgi:hypothetical protein
VTGSASPCRAGFYSKQALIFARVLGNGVEDGFFGRREVPVAIRNLIDAPLPERGTIVSSPIHVKQRPPKAVTLDDWANKHRRDVDGAIAEAKNASYLMCKHLLMGWHLGAHLRSPSDLEACRNAKPAEALHDGFLQEFAWEFLVGP